MISLLTMIAAILPLAPRVLKQLRRARPSARWTVAKPGTRPISATAAALDGFCARMNDGLAAVALVLAVGLTLTTMIQHPEAFLPDRETETGVAAGDILLTP